MKQKPSSRKRRSSSKSILRLPDLEHAKAAVLNSLNSVDAKRGYRHAIDEFVDWYCSEPRLAFNRIVVLRYRSHLESRQLAENVRCGILHQGETTGGWLVERNGRLFDGQKRINAKLFHDKLALAIDDYVAELERPRARSKVRPNFDKKMKAVIKNCD